MAGAFATAAAIKKDPSLCLSAVQAQAILDMRLQRLTGLEREKILDELAELEKTIAKLKAILADETLLLKVIKEELQQVADQFGNDRRTEIVGYSGEIRMEDVVPDDPMVVTMSKAGYIKRTDLNAYRRQSRGGKGKVGMKTKDEDFVEQLFMTKAHDTLMAFTDRAYVYALKVYDLPEAAASTRGKHIRNLDLPQGRGERRHPHGPAGIPRGRVPGLRHQRRHREEVQPGGLRQHPGQRPHRPQHR